MKVWGVQNGPLRFKIRQLFRAGLNKHIERKLIVLWILIDNPNGQAQLGMGPGFCVADIELSAVQIGEYFLFKRLKCGLVKGLIHFSPPNAVGG